MYVYLYDNFLRQKRFDATVKAMETRLTDFGIAGKIIRLQGFASPELIVEEERRRGATVVVIVGNDTTFGAVLARAAGTDMLFGFLPVGAEDNSIADVLGIPVGVAACDILARRRKLTLDVGWISNRNRYFVSRLHIPSSDIRVAYDERFTVSSRNQRMELVVCNLQPFTWRDAKQKEYVIHPQDGKLEAFLRPMVKKGIFRDSFEPPSVFPFEEMTITSPTPFVVEADGNRTKETKITIKLAKNRIAMIVGKERRF